jgi:hypothetical protein
MPVAFYGYQRCPSGLVVFSLALRSHEGPAILNAELTANLPSQANIVNEASVEIYLSSPCIKMRSAPTYSPALLPLRFIAVNWTLGRLR